MSSNGSARTSRSSITSPKFPFKMKGRKSLLKGMKSMFRNKEAKKQTAKTGDESNITTTERNPNDEKDRMPVVGLSYMRHAEGEDFLKINRFSVVVDKTGEESRPAESDSGVAAINAANNANSDDQISRDISTSEIGDLVCENDQNKTNEQLEGASKEVAGTHGEKEPRTSGTFDRFPAAGSAVHTGNSKESHEGTETIPEEIKPECLPVETQLVRLHKWCSMEGSRWKYVLLSLWTAVISLALAAFLCRETTNQDQSTTSAEPPSDSARGRTYLVYIYLGLLVSALGITVWCVWTWYANKRRESQRKECEERLKKSVESAKRNAIKNDANMLGGILIFVVCISMPILAFGAMIHTLGKLFSFLDRFLDVLGQTRAKDSEDKSGSSRSYVGQSRSGQADRQHSSWPGGVSQEYRSYKTSVGRTLLMVFVPFLIPVIFWKAKAKTQQQKASMTPKSQSIVSQSKTSQHSQSSSIIKRVIQSAIANSLKPGQGGPRFTRTELSRGPPQLRYLAPRGGRGRPCRCKGNNCTIL